MNPPKKKQTISLSGDAPGVAMVVAALADHGYLDTGKES